VAEFGYRTGDFGLALQLLGTFRFDFDTSFTHAIEYSLIIHGYSLSLDRVLGLLGRRIPCSVAIKLERIDNYAAQDDESTLVHSRVDASASGWVDLASFREG
jgi:hypothetical protein